MNVGDRNLAEEIGAIIRMVDDKVTWVPGGQ